MTLTHTECGGDIKEFEHSTRSKYWICTKCLRAVSNTDKIDGLDPD